jgi:regulator of sirC expression with transglutaminase-like and TPR domain
MATSKPELDERRLLARRRFCEWVARDDASIDVAEAALWIAAEARPDIDVAVQLRELDHLAAQARSVVEQAAGERARVEALCRALFEHERFHGNRDDYGDPDNSMLDQVLERRTGLPITLAVVFVEVAQRLGLHAAGVGFPGHFLAKVVGREVLLVDAFEGRIVSQTEARERLARMFEGRVEFDANLLRSARPKEILARILTNLKQTYIERSEFAAALACCDRLLAIVPNAPLELRDRGLLYQRLECFRAAVEDLEQFLRLAPKHESAENVRAVIEPLRRRVRMLN